MNPKERFEDKTIIGKGKYGKVYRAMDKKLNRIVAVKRIKIENENEGIPITTLREIVFLKGVKHRNVVELLDTLIDNERNQIYLVLECVDSDLRKFLDCVPKEEKISKPHVKKIFYGLMMGISFIHSCKIIHRDLKTQNVLIDKALNIKIADFGLARTFSSEARPYSEEVVTLWYRAPELLLGNCEYSTAIDLWSAGCIFFEVMTKVPLFMGTSEKDQIRKIFEILGVPSEQELPEIKKIKVGQENFVQKTTLKELTEAYGFNEIERDLIDKLLTFDSAKRLSAKTALAHPYFDDVN